MGSNKDEKVALGIFTFFGLAISAFLLISLLNSPRSHLKPNHSAEYSKFDTNHLYQNIGVATKSMFFHDLKKTKP